MTFHFNHDANVPFGIETPRIIEKGMSKDTSYILKSKMAAVGHIGKQVQPIAQKLFVLETIMIHVF